jgi:hypothetical protein
MPFKKGQSGNPGGRPKVEKEIKLLAKQHTQEALERLLHWMRSDDPRASVQAAIAILDRGHGKPPQQLDIDATHRDIDVTANPLSEFAWDQRYGRRTN